MANFLDQNGLGQVLLSLRTEFTDLRQTIEKQFFVPVTNITGLPSSMTAGVPLILSGAVSPNNATHKTIAWRIITFWGTGHTYLSGNTLYTSSSGTVRVEARIVNGTAIGTDFILTFDIAVYCGSGGCGCCGGGWGCC